MNIWKSSLGRAKFRRLLWHKSRENSDIVDVGFFDEKEEEYRNSNPEWFQEDENQDNVEYVSPETDRLYNLEESI